MCRGLLLLFVALPLLPGSTRALELEVVTKALVSEGWHPWYEVKADPENSSNVIICGTKWDAQHNAPFGFIYASSDGGTTWRSALEDRSTTWVTEHSCAFGRGHRAYFISEASKVIDGEPHHGLGVTRLYLSSDGGQNWKETARTGWADWSTSAVSSSSGKLYTFFNATTGDAGRGLGSNVGLLIFSTDGKKVTGPFFDSSVQGLGYRGVFPSHAIALTSGAVIALYYGIKQGSPGVEASLGIVRADPSREPSLHHSEILRTIVNEDCFGPDDSSMAYDRARNRLYVVYVDRCKDARLMLTWSDDEGKTWAKAAIVPSARWPPRTMANPSLAVGQNGTLTILWEQCQRSGRWLLSTIQNEKLIEPPLELSRGPDTLDPSNDSLWAWVNQSTGLQGEATDNPSTSTATLEIRTELNIIWRGSGLLSVGDKMLAAWSSGTRAGMRLYVGAVGPAASSSEPARIDHAQRDDSRDVTSQTVLLYAGPLHFDHATGTLKVCLALGNRGSDPIFAPIKLEVKDLRSPGGTVSVVNSTNHLEGVGAVWDISDSITGRRIPPDTSSNPFCLFFHVETVSNAVSPLQDDLLTMKVTVLAPANGCHGQGAQSKK